MVVMKFLRALTSLPLYKRHPTITHLLLLTLLALPALWPLYVVILPATGDGHLHLMRLTVLDRYLAQGNYYPRWASELALGYGHPVFSYYAPSTYALIELLHGLGLPHIQGYRFAIALFILLAGYGSYLWAQDFYAPTDSARWAALLTATAYLYAPYFLTTAHFRGALAETGAQALLPWILWSFRRLYKASQPSRYLLVAVLTLGTLAITHNITLLFAPFLLLGYIGALWLDDRQARRDKLRRLGWVVVACLGAMGISSFFWLPMAVERHYLSDFSYSVSKMLVPDHLWTWANFLDWHFYFDYTENAPFKLGLMHSGLALVGLGITLFARRQRTWEWWYWLGVAAVALLGMSGPAEPLWLGNQYLLITQFPWRLLTFTALSFALFTGALVGALQQRWARGAVPLLLIGIVILSNRPTTARLETSLVNDLNFSLPAVNHYELDTGAFGASLGREFMPRDTDDFVITDVPATRELASDPVVSLQGADAQQVNLSINSATPIKLRFTNFYFPGWQAILDPQSAQRQVLTLYPSTRQALATVEVPAGQHQLVYRWQGTDLQRWSSYLSLATLLGLALFVARPATHNLGGRKMVLIPLLFCSLGAWATFRPPQAAPPPLVPAVQTIAPGLEMLGYYTEQLEPDKLYLWPYWFVKQPQADLTFQLTLVDTAGATRSEVIAYPHFNTQRSSGWSAGMVVDDAYQLPLPPGLPAGSYTIRIQPLDGETAVAAPQTIGPIAIAAVPVASPVPMQPLALRFEQAALLDGYNIKINRQAVAVTADAAPLIVRPADTVEIKLYWREQNSILESYHSFIHLVDWQQVTLLQQDQLPGPIMSTPLLWNRDTAMPDLYRFKIPADAASGLYTPRVGLYRFTSQDFSDQDRLLIFNARGNEVGDAVNLPPFKIYNPRQGVPSQLNTIPVNTTFTDLATLTGYQLEPDDATIAPGETVTVTLVYQSHGPASIDYTQFIQLYDPTLGIAGQIDRQPLAGGNPTSTWVAGETIVETVAFVTKTDATPGHYRLQVGFYDHMTGERRPVTGVNGTPLPDQRVILAELQLQDPAHGRE